MESLGELAGGFEVSRGSTWGGTAAGKDLSEPVHRYEWQSFTHKTQTVGRLSALAGWTFSALVLEAAMLTNECVKVQGSKERCERDRKDRESVWCRLKKRMVSVGVNHMDSWVDSNSVIGRPADMRARSETQGGKARVGGGEVNVLSRRIPAVAASNTWSIECHVVPMSRDAS